jgi:hypothetical protein
VADELEIAKDLKARGELEAAVGLLESTIRKEEREHIIRADLY